MLVRIRRRPPANPVLAPCSPAPAPHCGAETARTARSPPGAARRGRRRIDPAQQAVLVAHQLDLGAAIGVLLGHAFDNDWFRLSRDTPYRELGLTREASDAEIDLAYRRLISQYHPDKVAGAAPELRDAAEKRAREINAAYDRIKTLRKR